MTTIPRHPKIYHITHINNLRAIATSGELVSDAIRIQRDINCSLVGMSTIKQRRLTEIEVDVCPGTTVGEYVPFYFCPRSIMLYILYRANHPELTYRGGQQTIVHLEVDLNEAIKWAEARQEPWAFTDRNAGAYFVQFYNRQTDLNRIDWNAVAATDFREPQIKDGKQAEFLSYATFPWTLIRKIGTIDPVMANQVREAISGTSHQPTVKVQRGWYF